MPRPGSADGLLRALRERDPAPGRVALVCAHPDDETIGAGASLFLLPGVLLVHVTDGAPRTLADARAAGFGTAAEYAAARRAELRAALDLGGVRAETVELGVPDQGASEAMAEIARRLAGLFARHGIGACITHPYEGGHPDHDATAWAVACAARAAGVETVEMLSYHAAPDGGADEGSRGGVEADRFLPGPDPVVHVLTPAERARKAAMFRAFTTQSHVLAPFPLAHEAFRPAPAYDFSAPPHPGTLHYERFDWGMTGVRWRTLAARAEEETACAA